MQRWAGSCNTHECGEFPCGGNRKGIGEGKRRRKQEEGDEARDWETRGWHQQPEGKEKGSQGHDDGLQGKNVVEKRHTEKKMVSGSARG